MVVTDASVAADVFLAVGALGDPAGADALALEGFFAFFEAVFAFDDCSEAESGFFRFFLEGFAATFVSVAGSPPGMSFA